MSPKRQFDTLEELVQHWKAPEPSSDFVERTLKRLDAAAPAPVPTSPWHRPLRVPLVAAMAIAAVILASLIFNILSWKALQRSPKSGPKAPAKAVNVPLDLYALHEPLPDAAGAVISLPLVPGAACELDLSGTREALRIQRSRAW